MEIKDAIRAAIEELILPDMNKIRADNNEIKVALNLTNKRLDDMNGHLIDQSRRIDEVNKRIDEINRSVNQRFDEINKSINQRFEETNKRIDALRIELRGEIAKTNIRLDRLYEVIVRRDEHEILERRMAHLEKEVNDIKRAIAA